MTLLAAATAARSATAATLRRVLQGLVLIEAGIDFELNTHFADLKCSFRRVTGNAGVRRSSPRFDLILADARRTNEKHLRRIGDAGVAAGSFFVVAELGLQPCTIVQTALFVVIRQRVHLRVRALPFFIQLVGNGRESSLVSATVTDEQNVLEAMRLQASCRSVEQHV